jgi:hypothetical protein
MAAFRLILASRKRPPLRCGVPLLLARIESQITVPHRGVAHSGATPPGRWAPQVLPFLRKDVLRMRRNIMLETERKGGFDFADDA